MKACPSGRGRFRRLPLQRRWIADLMAACASRPVMAADRLMRIKDAAQARRTVANPPGWTAIIIKAYAIVAARDAALRQAYFSLPWPHLYEHPVSVVGVVVEREWNGASAVFFDQIVAPEALPLREIDAIVRGLRDRKVESVGGFRRQIRFSRLPMPLRRLFWWLGLRVSGYLHARYFGTFAVNSITLPRAGVVQTTSPITMSLVHMPLAPQGHMLLVGAFDHRVLDGMQVGRALGQVEAAINNEIRDELLAMAAGQIAGATSKTSGST